MNVLQTNKLLFWILICLISSNKQSICMDQAETVQAAIDYAAEGATTARVLSDQFIKVTKCFFTNQPPAEDPIAAVQTVINKQDALFLNLFPALYSRSSTWEMYQTALDQYKSYTEAVLRHLVAFQIDQALVEYQNHENYVAVLSITQMMFKNITIHFSGLAHRIFIEPGMSKLV